MSQRPVSVMIADDSADDRFFLKRAIASAAPYLHVMAELQNGEEIIHYLARDGPFSDGRRFPIPDLLLMDWRMPLMGGSEVLEWLQKHPIPHLKVAVLAETSETNQKDKALAMGAHFIFCKQCTPEELIHTVRELQDYCLRGNE